RENPFLTAWVWTKACPSPLRQPLKRSTIGLGTPIPPKAFGGSKPMSSDGSVSHWIRQLQAGDHAAAQKLWEGYFHRLVGLARAKMRGVSRRAADEEDVALSAFDSFCRGAEQGRFPKLQDRD